MKRRVAIVALVGWGLTLILLAVGGWHFADELRARGWLSRTIVIGVVVSVPILARVLRRRDDEHPVVPWVPFLLTFVAAGWLMTWWSLPEERAHVAQYLPLGVLAWLATGGRAGWALLISVAFGVGDELCQGLLPDRRFDPWDVAADAVASGAGILLASGGRAAWGAVALLCAARLIFPVVHEGHLGINFVPNVGNPDPDAPYEGAHVLLVTVDALRADKVPPTGGTGVPLPAFERLGRESIVFDDAYANSIWTTPSMVSLLSGFWPATHGVHARGQELGPRVVTPVEYLRGAGYRTFGYAGDDSETYRHLGFEAEIDRDADPADVVAAHLGAGPDAAPTLLWLHLRDVHAPYDATPERLAELGLPDRLPDSPLLERARTSYTVPRADFPGRHDWLAEPIAALYAAEVVDADATLGRILDRLDAEGLADRTILVVTADHGEELLERDGIGHASTTLDSVPHPELVRIPMYLRFPDGRGAGRRIAGARFEQVDVLPALMPFLGFDVSFMARPWDGRWWWYYPLSDPHAGPPEPRDLLVSSTPCGWQCPPERRSERVHALVSDDGWTWCREDSGTCPPGALADALALARSRRDGHGTPVRSPR